MKDVMTQGTGVAANISNMPVAGKSGTTTKTATLYSQDFLHIIPVLFWGGYDDNSPLKSTRYTKTYGKPSCSVWNEGLEYCDFEKTGRH